VVDGDDIALWRPPNIKRRLTLLRAPGIVFPLGDAARRPAAVVVRVVVVPAF
jgi:hypothetical protein